MGFVAGDVADAGPFIAAAKAEDSVGVNLTAEMTLGQIAIKNGKYDLVTGYMRYLCNKAISGRP